MPKHHTMKCIGGLKVRHHAFSIFTLDGCEIWGFPQDKVFWFVKPCSVVVGYCFGGPCYLHFLDEAWRKGSKVLWNVGILLQHYMALHPRRLRLDSYILWMFHFQGKSPWYTLDRRLRSQSFWTQWWRGLHVPLLGSKFQLPNPQSIPCVINI